MDALQKEVDDLENQLKQAEDAALLDTTRLNLEQSLEALLSLVKEKIAQ